MPDPNQLLRNLTPTPTPRPGPIPVYVNGRHVAGPEAPGPMTLAQTGEAIGSELSQVPPALESSLGATGRANRRADYFRSRGLAVPGPMGTAPSYFSEPGGPQPTSWLQEQATAMAEGDDGSDAVDLASLITKLPTAATRSGLLTRLAQGPEALTPTDHLYLTNALGSDPTPELQAKIARGLLSSYANQAVQPSAQPQSSSALSGMSLSTMSPDQLSAMNDIAGSVPPTPPPTPFRLSTVGPEQAAKLGLPQIPASGNAPAQGFGPANVAFDQSGNLHIIAFTDEKGEKHLSPDIMYGDDQLKSFVRQNASALGVPLSEFSDFEKQQTEISVALRKQGQDEINNGLDADLKKLQIQVQQGALDKQRATADAEARIAEANAHRAELDVELAKLDLQMKPVALAEAQARTSLTNLQITQAQQKFPLEMEQMQAQLADARESLRAREQARLNTQAGNQYASQIYPALLSFFSGAGQGNTMQTAQNLAAGAGTDINDPAAQAAFAVMQRTYGGGQ